MFGDYNPIYTMDGEFVGTFMYFLVSLSLYFEALVGDFSVLVAMLP